jgi:hypothetical protein
MKKDTKKTPFVFFREDDQNILAVITKDRERNGNYTCYAHVGQHGTVDPAYIKDLPTVSFEDAEPLIKELENIGYNVQYLSKLPWQQVVYK